MRIEKPGLGHGQSRSRKTNAKIRKTKNRGENQKISWTELTPVRGPDQGPMKGKVVRGHVIVKNLQGHGQKLQRKQK